MQKFKLALSSLLLSLTLLTGMTSVAVFADTPKQDACAALTQIDSSRSCDSKDTGVNDLIKTIVNILSMIVGVAAVIMVIISGLKFVTSAGDSGGVASARNTLLYSLVGLFIVALAQVIVHFVIGTATK